MRLSEVTVRSMMPSGGAAYKKNEIFGVELELEGYNLWPFAREFPHGDPRREIAKDESVILEKYWSIKTDGSLRPYRVKTEDELHRLMANGIVHSTPNTWTPAEFVIRRPVSANVLEKRALPAVRNYLNAQRARIPGSSRCSSHVHVNFMDETMASAALAFFLYALFEDVIAPWIGEERDVNLFCVNSKCSSAILEKAVEVFDPALKFTYLRQVASGTSNDHLKYWACNLSPLFRIGTLEFRAFPGIGGDVKFSDLALWVKFLKCIRNWATNHTFADFEQLTNLLSMEHVGGLLSVVFVEYPEVKEHLIKLNGSEFNITQKLFSALDRIQYYTAFLRTVE